MLLPTQSTNQAIEATIIQLIEAMTESWDFDDALETITPSAQLIADLGFSSVDFVQLFVAVEEAFGRKLGFHDLIMPQDKYVDDLSVAQIVTYVEAKLRAQPGEGALPTLRSHPTVPVQRLTVADLKALRQVIRSPEAVATSATNRVAPSPNPPAIFILSPPRSGSTLFRIMLAGHPKLFAPPELHLLTYSTLQERWQALNNDFNRHLLDGTVRALKEITSCSDEEAVQRMSHYEAQNLTVQAFYLELQQGLGDRLLVDKTPSYSYHIDILNRIETLFKDALYIHLIRHPYGMIRSFQDAKLDQLVPFLRQSAFSSRERAELIWLMSHQNIGDFLQRVPAERQLQIRYEDLVKTAERTMQQVCEFLNIPFVSAMLNPYQNKAQRMLDGIQTPLERSGDLKFHLHGSIEASRADHWRQFHHEDFLGDDAIQMARSFGYEV